MVADVQGDHGNDKSSIGGSVHFLPSTLSTRYVQFSLDCTICRVLINIQRRLYHDVLVYAETKTEGFGAAMIGASRKKRFQPVYKAIFAMI